MDYLDLEKNASAFDNFWYKARRDLIKKLMIRHGISNKNILEIGCGAGSQLEALSIFDNKVIGSDINAKALEVAKSRGHNVFFQNIEQALEHEIKYDLICAFDVLEHIEHDEKAMTNIYSMLKPDGLFMYSVPAYQFLFSSHDVYLEHFRRYSKKELKDKLSDKGFKQVERGYWNSFLFPVMIAKRLISRKAKPQSETYDLPIVINELLYWMLKVENRLFKYKIRFPFGLSIVGVVKK